MSNVSKYIKGYDVDIATIQFNGATASLCVDEIIPIADIDDYQVYIYTLSGGVKTNWFSFKKTPVGNDGSFVSVDANTIGFIVNREMTNVIPAGTVYVEIAYRVSATGVFINSMKKFGSDGLILCELVESASSLSMT